jgi:hypothetical protein
MKTAYYYRGHKTGYVSYVGVNNDDEATRDYLIKEFVSDRTTWLCLIWSETSIEDRMG